ncbi:MAG: hypothetical protein CMO56_02905, partial [Verrucomicrobiales bacterium]|nr:hypothetical protein [Verrucomicrobiales bacterium]
MRLLILLFLLFNSGGNFALDASENSVNVKSSEKLWSFVNPKKSSPPETIDSNWARGNIDRFILDKLEENGLEPEKEAIPEVIVRRLFFDLLGIPPSFDEIEKYKKVDDPNNYARLIDQLLERPEFGERLASSWMNVARYAEDQAHQVGSDKKFFYPYAHKYRQWVIEAFNNDLPYDDFIRLQLAADKVDDVDEKDFAALGFLGLGPQYYNRGRLEVKAEEWEDSVDVVSRGFMALTVACARCHDHKYDPISTADYHAFAGVFASTEIHKREIVDSTGDKSHIHIVKDGKVQDLPIFKRGDVTDKGEVIPRGFLEILSDRDSKKYTNGSGRLELANAIASSENPLTARVAVNRIWQLFFGQGLVKTTSNFGSLGGLPSHPELLDYLAVTFMENGWSIKDLIKRILLSSTYRQSSFVISLKRQKDEENKYYSYFPRRRLSAEMLRDSMLLVSGEMERGDRGAESLKVSDKKNLRRTIYSRISRKELDHYLALFDYPDPNIHSSSRDETITPAQKLYFINSEFVIERSKKISLEITSNNINESIIKMYQKILSRSPSNQELLRSVEYIGVVEEKKEERWQRFAQNLLISNEF